MKHALILTEARGQAIHLREDANINLLQAGHLAQRFARKGFATRLRLILDGGQSPEEYSLLCHLENDVVEGFRRTVAAAPDPARTRRDVVREIRETLLPIALRTSHAGVADDLFFAPVVAQVSGLNPRLRHLVLSTPHPLIEAGRVDEYEAVLHAYGGSGYLDLEEGVARHALARALDVEAAMVDVSALRPSHDPCAWFQATDVRAVVTADLREKESGGAGRDFHSRLIGLFPAVPDGDGRFYFNSPTSCRLEHGRARILPRDRFGILGLRGSERVAFPRLRALLREQEEGSPTRLVGVKYPYAARILAAGVAREAAALSHDGPVKVVFIEGSEGTVNPGTGGLLDALLAGLVAPFADYHRFVARDAVRKQLPIRPGGLPLIQDALGPLVPSSFSPPIDEQRLFASHGLRNRALLTTH
jgi:hypothetical protein